MNNNEPCLVRQGDLKRLTHDGCNTVVVTVWLHLKHFVHSATFPHCSKLLQSLFIKEIITVNLKHKED